MGRLNSFQGSIASFVLRGFAALVRALPFKAALFIGRRIGDIAFCISPRQRRLAVSHLKVAFGKSRSSTELWAIVRDFYHGYGQSIVELACIPRIVSRGYEGLVDIEGREHVDRAMKKGHGCIFLSIHSGNWELSNLVGSMLGYPYNMVANDLNNINKVAEFLNELRRTAGCRIINPGIGGREIIRRLMKNEIVTLVADQGGSDGSMVPFFGRNSSMSTGAVRIALKYDVPIMLVNIKRIGAGRHKLVAEPLELVNTGDVPKDLDENLRRMMSRYELWIDEHPQEYVWFYKTWKYAKDRVALILDDGRVGHLRQSQAVARAYVQAAKEKGLAVSVETVTVCFKSRLAANILPFFSGGSFLYGGADMRFLAGYIEPESMASLQALRPDIVISCGSRNASVNWWVARDHRAISVAVLPNRLLPSELFDLRVVHQHDVGGERLSLNTVVTKGALNLIDKAYLDENLRALTSRYQHLRHKVRSKVAFLVGGDAQGVAMSEQAMKIVVHQLKSAAEEFGLDILVTTSRRTPPSVEQMVVREFKDHERCALLILANKGNVPEAVGGVLALADIVVVSGESISMVSEAASSGKRTIVFPVSASINNKYASFCDKLAQQGHIIYTQPKGMAAAIDAVLRNKVVTKPVNDGAVIAQALEKIVR